MGVDWRYRRPQEVFKAGTGMAVSNVVTRRNNALTGHDVGRCRSIRSLSCLIWVATVHRVRITVPGWAVARAVWASVGVRRAWWRTYAAHDTRSRVALARHVVAEVRSRWRAHLTALIAFSPFPRAQERSSYTCWGVDASQEGTTKRGLSPAAMTSAFTITRHGRSHEAAAEEKSSETRRRGGGGSP